MWDSEDKNLHVVLQRLDLKPSQAASDSAVVMPDHQADAPIPEEYHEDVWPPLPSPLSPCPLSGTIRLPTYAASPDS